MDISIISAVSSNRVIGKDGTLPWSIPEDLNRFKHLTYGRNVIMGLRTFESLRKPLEGRQNIVLSSTIGEGSYDGFMVCRNLEAALSKCVGPTFVIGGNRVYVEALPLANVLYITEVHTRCEGDTFFPYFDRNEWVEVSRVRKSGSPPDTPDYSFVIYTRKS